MIRLRDYQEAAVADLLDKSRRLMALEGTKRLVFKAPTGSGKTVMMAEFLKRLAEGSASTSSAAGGSTASVGNSPLVFIWTAPRKLHTQSKEKLEAYYAENRALKCVEFEELNDRQIKEGEILFFNWEHIRREDNVYIRENEQDFNLSSVIENTRDAGREIVLVIDEAHYAASTVIAQGIVEMIAPTLMVDVSATPQVQGDEFVNVFRQDVIAEGMIKRQVAINPGFKNLIEGKTKDGIKVTSEASQSTDEMILAAAIKKREEIKEAFGNEGTGVNPLLLVQIPDQRQGALLNYEAEIERMLREKHGITIENGRLAIYLSENKENLENLTRNDNEAEVMIFKQAIALGWDCPRASILCLFRDWQNATFSTQTLGRILRMPELKHYENEELNTAFVYTTVSDLSVLEDAAGDYITIQYSKRKDIYQDLNLTAVHTKRRREMTRLSPQFIPSFMDAGKILNLEKSLDLKKRTVRRTLLTDGEIGNIDQEIHHVAEGEERNGYHAGEVDHLLNNEEIQKEFDQFAANTLKPEFFPEARSVDRVKTALYQFFYMAYPGKFKKLDSEIQKVVLDADNQKHVINALNKAKELYQESIETEERELIEQQNWEITKSFNYNNSYARRDYNKAVMDPFYERTDAPTGEKDFAAYLDRNEKVAWWYKSGERDAVFFAVPYEMNGANHPFYVDWLVMFADGRLGLFDTKAGMTADTSETKSKAEGLQAYIKAENKKGKNLIGGIVIEKRDSWRVNDSTEYSYNENDLSRWQFFESL